MIRVQILGAGSIGNHLAHACRSQQWDVLVSDIDAEALERMKKDIYPARYGAWDTAIQLSDSVDVEEPPDIIIIGTPPDTHMKLAIDVVEKQAPRVLLVEKPLATPGLDGCQQLMDELVARGITGLVGYNHVLTENTRIAERLLCDGVIGDPISIHVRWQEHWGGIFSAHPWLAGPKASYLGFSERGGGACGEHSHAINIWQHFASVLGMGRVSHVSAVMDRVKSNGCDYDRIAQISLETEHGFVGSVVQDVVTEPPIKHVRIQGEKGYLEWFANYEAGVDAVIWADDTGKGGTELIKKTRSDDFIGEVQHITEILQGGEEQSPIHVRRGMATMLVVAAAYKSHLERKPVSIDHDAGYKPSALVVSS